VSPDVVRVEVMNGLSSTYLSVIIGATENILHSTDKMAEHHHTYTIFML
jgi:hypothetical protein